MLYKRFYVQSDLNEYNAVLSNPEMNPSYLEIFQKLLYRLRPL